MEEAVKHWLKKSLCERLEYLIKTKFFRAQVYGASKDSKVELMDSH